MSQFSACVLQTLKQSRHRSCPKYLSRTFSAFHCFHLCCELFSSFDLKFCPCTSVTYRLRRNNSTSYTCVMSVHTLGSHQLFCVFFFNHNMCIPLPHLLRRCYSGSEKFSVSQEYVPLQYACRLTSLSYHEPARIYPQSVLLLTETVTVPNVLLCIFVLGVDFLYHVFKNPVIKCVSKFA